MIKQTLWFSQQILEFHPDNATTLTRTISTNILGVYFQQQLNEDDHITELSKTSYATLSALRKMKRIAPFNIRKHVCESLVLSKLDYCISVFDPLTFINKDNYRKSKFLVLHLFLIDTAQRQMHFHWGGYQLQNVLGWELPTYVIKPYITKTFLST